MTDNPIMEPADKFYNTEVTEPEVPTETPAVEEVIEPDKEIESKEPEQSEKSESTDEEKESQYITLDGKEIDLDDVKKWRDGHLMQSDYTKKTTAHARQVEKDNADISSKREQLANDQAKLTEDLDMLSVLVQEDEQVNWAELKADDPDRYIELKELADKRKEALSKIKADRATPADDPALVAEEQRKLFEANPEWFDDDKPTETFQKDTQLINEYAAMAGFSSEEFSQLTRAHHIQTLLKAAKYDQLQKKGQEIKSKRVEVPVVTKPKAKAASAPKAAHEVFYGT